MKIKDLNITYMGRTCSLSDVLEYNPDNISNLELKKIGAIVYINSQVNRIDLDKKDMCFDLILEYLQFNLEKSKFLLIKIISDKKMKTVPDFVKDIFELEDDDEIYDLFVKFLKEKVIL